MPKSWLLMGILPFYIEIMGLKLLWVSQYIFNVFSYLSEYGEMPYQNMQNQTILCTKKKV
jgi:hypothetical protein